MNIDNLSKRQIETLKVNVVTFEKYLQLALSGKLKTNKDICGFKLLAPINNRDYTQLVFRGNYVGSVHSDGTIKINTYSKPVWGKDKLKYEILCELKDKLCGSEEEQEPVVVKRIKKGKNERT